MRDILLVLMEGKAFTILLVHIIIDLDHFLLVLPLLFFPGTPSGVRYSEVRDRVLTVNGVKAVHNLHIWALTMNQAVLSAHIAIGEKNQSFTSKLVLYFN